MGLFGSHSMTLFSKWLLCLHLFSESSSLSLLLSQGGILTTFQQLSNSVLVSIGTPPSGRTQHLQFLRFLRFLWVTQDGS